MAGARKGAQEAFPGTLYVVATPIGNLEDITLRALRILREVDVVAAEGVEHTRKLCRHFEIRARLTSYNQNNRRRKEPELLKKLRAGRCVALVTNAGTPGISDPGSELVRRAREEGIPVLAVPGPCAAAAALSASGFRSDGFLFAGFLSSRPGRRRRELEQLTSETRTLVFYEAPHRIQAMLQDLCTVLGDRMGAVVREMTKVHEETLRGSLSRLAEQMDEDRARGEIVVLVEGAEEGPAVHVSKDSELRKRIEAMLQRGDLSLGDVARKLSLEQGVGYRHIYRMCLSVKASQRNP